MNNVDPGDKLALPEDYARLMAMAEKEDSRVGTTGPESPYPAQPAALVGWRDNTFQFLPSANYQAAVQFEVLERFCSVIDPILIGDLGYGLGDVVELTLRRIDHVVTSVATAWGDEPTPEFPINPREIEAAMSLLCLSTQAEECLYPAQAKLALERFTVPPEMLSDYLNLRTAHRPAMAVWALHGGTPDGRVPLPAGVLVKPLRDITELLAYRAISINPDVQATFEFELGKMVFEEMRRYGHRMRGLIMLSSGDQAAYLVAEYQDRGVLLVDVGATVGQATAKARVKSGARGLYELASGVDFQSSFDATDLAGANVAFLQVLFSTDRQLGTDRYDSEVAGICAFLELLRSLDAPEDLCAVLESRSALDNIRSEVGLAEWGGLGFGQDISLLELWKIWKDHGNRLTPLAVHFAEMLATPGVPGRELAGTPEFSDIEQLLARYGQPELSTWPRVFRDEYQTVLTDPSTGMCSFILPWAPPVVVDASRSLATTSPEGYTWELGMWILLRLAAVKGAFISSARDCGLDSLYIRIVRDTVTQPVPMRVVERSASAIVIGWNEACIDTKSIDPLFMDLTLGHCLAECFDSPSVNTAFFQAWRASYPSGADGENAGL